jgi:hypothetical protein
MHIINKVYIPNKVYIYIPSLCIEFETQVAVEDNEIINYISKSNVDQAIEVLETFYFYYYRSIEKRSNFGT